MIRVPARVLAAGLALLLLVPSLHADQLTLDVDATQAPKKVLHARMVIPARPGPLTLLYPKWIPGEHAPSGPINDLVGLKIRAGDKALHWRRDDTDMFAFHVEVPEGASSVEASLDFLLPASKEGFSAAASSSAKLAIISWNQLLLYPQGRPARDISYRASIKLPAGWKLGTALTVADKAGPVTTFKPVPLDMLVDSPVLCGAHLKEVPIGPAAGPAHFVVIACDSEEGLELDPDWKAKYDRLVEETGKLFGSRHYHSYRFLLTLSDHVAHFGLEHHQCSDDRAPERMLIDDDLRKVHATLLPHEFVHSWNGKHRRPADMVTDDLHQPQRTRLLWVYEGLTQYLEVVLLARAGFWSDEESRDNLAVIAEWAQNQRGRSWRPLDDTAAAAQHLYNAPRTGASWRRGVDFYDEGVLLWLDVDTLIREQTDGKKSLDDFCRRFFGGPGGEPTVRPYTFDELVENLNAVAPYDWKGFLTRRVSTPDPKAPLEGIHRGGWRLKYSDKQSELHRLQEADNKGVNLSTTLGLTLRDDGSVEDVIPEKPADRAGVGPGMKVVAVNARRFTEQVLRSAVTATKESERGVELLIENGDFFQTLKLDYKGGDKYPHLVKDPAAKQDRLADILKPLAGKAADAQ